jgi:hypothetical protein
MTYTGPLTGGCQCGAVRYAIRQTNGRPGICHCRMCQKASGNYFSATAGAAHFDDVTVTRGAFSCFVSSGTGERLFCSQCGTPLAFRSTTEPLIWVTVGSLDDPTLAQPVHQIGVESRLPWLDQALQAPQRRTGANNPRFAAHAEGRADNFQHPDHDTPEWPIPR